VRDKSPSSGQDQALWYKHLDAVVACRIAISQVAEQPGMPRVSSIPLSASLLVQPKGRVLAWRYAKFPAIIPCVGVPPAPG